MDYKEINSAILQNRDINESLVKKDEKFYRYLLNNKVAYYYSKFLSKRPTEREAELIASGDALNERYYKTLFKIIEICNKHNLEFLLYKTHKYIPEVVDGDIDLFVHENDFGRFLKAFENEGFDCVEDEPGKGKCEKNGYCVIEPHVGISWRGGVYMNEDEIWIDPVERIFYEKETVMVCSDKVELFSFLGKVFYEPAYADLYTIMAAKKQLESMRANRMFSKRVQDSPALSTLLEKMDAEKILTNKLPYFLRAGEFFKEWSRVSIQHGRVFTYVAHIIFYVYWRIRYRFMDILPFTHTW